VDDGDGEAAEIERLRAEVASLRAENEALRERAAELVGAEKALNHLLAEAREIRGGTLLHGSEKETRK
jgi:prefoldin subunit 5